MKLPKDAEKLKRETIRWVDPDSEDAWQEVSHARNDPPAFICESTGYVLMESEDMLRMALTIGYAPDGQICAVAQTFSIPKTCILKRRVK